MTQTRKAILTVITAVAILSGIASVHGISIAAPQTQQATAVQGTVYVDGVTSSGATVSAQAEEAAPVEATASDTGQYILSITGSGLPITFQVNGQPAKSYDTTGSEATFTTTPGSTITVNLAPASETPLSGIVDPAPPDQFAEFTGKVYAGQRAVYAGAKVSISLDNGANWPHSGTSDASGNYRLRIPADRTKTVSFMVDGTQSRQWTRYGRRTVEGTIKAVPGTVQVIDLTAQGADGPPKVTPPPAPPATQTPQAAPTPTPVLATVPPTAPTLTPVLATVPPTAPTLTPVLATVPPTAAPAPTEIPSTPESLIRSFRQGPTVRLRPVNDVIDQNKDGIVEVLFRNPAINERTMVVDLTVSVPSGIHIYGENYAQSSAAGAASNVYRVMPAQSQTIKLYIKSEKVGSYTISFSSTYWPEGRKELNNPVSLSHPFIVNAPSPAPFSSTPTDPSEAVVQQQATQPAPRPASGEGQQGGDPSASCSLSPDAEGGNADLALILMPAAGILGMIAIRRRKP